MFFSSEWYHHLFYKINKFFTRNIMSFNIQINFIRLIRQRKDFNIISSLYGHFGIYLCSLKIALRQVDFKSLVGVKLCHKNRMYNYVLFMGLRCARRSDVTSAPQKIALKTVYFFKILVVYKLTLSPHWSNFISGGLCQIPTSIQWNNNKTNK